MCGIVGIVNREAPQDSRILSAALDTMKLRDLNSILRVDIYGGWNTRKYKMIRDSVKNTKNYK